MPPETIIDPSGASTDAQTQKLGHVDHVVFPHRKDHSSVVIASRWYSSDQCGSTEDSAKLSLVKEERDEILQSAQVTVEKNYRSSDTTLAIKCSKSLASDSTDIGVDIMKEMNEGYDRLESSLQFDHKAHISSGYVSSKEWDGLFAAIKSSN